MTNNKTFVDQFLLDAKVSENESVLNNVSISQSISKLTSIIDPYYIQVYDSVLHFATLYVFMCFLLGVPGNVLVILVQGRVQQKTVTEWLIIYIAACDIMSLLNMPLFCLQLQKLWSLGVPDFFCKFHYLSINSVSMASYIFCAVTAVERFYKVVHSKEIFSMIQATLMWIPICIISFGFGFIIIFGVRNNLNNNCMLDINGRLFATIESALVSCVAFICSTVMVVSYLRIGLFLRIKMKEMSISHKCFSKSYKHLIQTTKMLAVVTAVFLTSSNIPYICGMIVTIKKPRNEPYLSIVLILGLTFFLNTFLNPFLYLAMSTSFRQSAKNLIIGSNSCLVSKYDIDKEARESSYGVSGKDTQTGN